jgi:hypothetical protein
MTPSPAPYDHPSAWLGPDMAQRTDWLVQLDEGDIAELEQALAAARRAGLGIPGLTKADVDVPPLRREDGRRASHARGRHRLRADPRPAAPEIAAELAH